MHYFFPLQCALCIRRVARFLSPQTDVCPRSDVYACKTISYQNTARKHQTQTLHAPQYCSGAKAIFKYSQWYCHSYLLFLEKYLPKPKQYKGNSQLKSCGQLALGWNCHVLRSHSFPQLICKMLLISIVQVLLYHSNIKYWFSSY